MGGGDVDMIEVPAQLTGDHLNGWRAEEVIILKSSEEPIRAFQSWTHDSSTFCSSNKDTWLILLHGGCWPVC